MMCLIAPNGELRTVYDEVLPWTEVGRCTIRRASRVEPTLDGEWFADLSPVAGPLLGPFPVRSLALQAEIAWLTEQGLPVPALA